MCERTHVGTLMLLGVLQKRIQAGPTILINRTNMDVDNEVRHSKHVMYRRSYQTENQLMCHRDYSQNTEYHRDKETLRSETEMEIREKLSDEPYTHTHTE